MLSKSTFGLGAAFLSQKRPFFPPFFTLPGPSNVIDGLVLGGGGRCDANGGDDGESTLGEEHVYVSFGVSVDYFG